MKSGMFFYNSFATGGLCFFLYSIIVCWPYFLPESAVLDGFFLKPVNAGVSFCNK